MLLQQSNKLNNFHTVFPFFGTFTKKMEIEIDNNLSIRELPIDKKTQQSEAHMYKLRQRGGNNVYMPKYQ